MFATLTFLLVLSVLVLVHEFGHFSVARKAGMKVEEFGIGFPPRLFAWGKGETTYSVNAIPLGGFVRIAGESGQEKGPRTFASGTYMQRAAVLLAGVAMNVLLGWVLFSVSFVAGSDMVVRAEIPKGAFVSNERVEITDVLPGLAAEATGVRAGDVWKAINGKAVQNAEQGRAMLAEQPQGSKVLLLVERGGAPVELMPTIGALPNGGTGIGVQVADKAFVRLSFFRAIGQATVFTGQTLVAIGRGFVGWVGGLFTGGGLGEVSGPVGIAKLTGQVAADGWRELVFFSAILSLNLAVLNAFPFPALDGGRLFLLFVEWVHRRPLPALWEQAFHGAGFALLISLVGVVTYKDLFG